MVKAEIANSPVTFDGDVWTAPDPQLRQTLETYENDYWANGPDYAPDRNRDIVEFAIADLGGQIVEADDPGGVDGRVY